MNWESALLQRAERQGQIIEQHKVVRSRLHYKQKSLAEILLTIGLSIFLGSGMLFLTMIDAQQKNAARQAQVDTQVETIEQCENLQSIKSTNISSAHKCQY